MDGMAKFPGVYNVAPDSSCFAVLMNGFSMIRVPLTLTLGLLRDLQMFLRGTSRVHGKFKAQTAPGVQQLIKYLETNSIGIFAANS